MLLTGRLVCNSRKFFRSKYLDWCSNILFYYRIAVAQDLSIIKSTSPNQQGRFISAAVAAAGFGSVGHSLSQEAHKENQEHFGEFDASEHEHGALGSHGHSHSHGHRGNFHGTHHDHHYEQIWNFSVI